MTYNVRKLIEILGLLAKHKQELTKLRITKLLFLVDKYHLRKFGRFVLGDKYYRLPYGPVPSFTLNLIDNFLCPVTFRGKTITSDEPFSEYFDRGKDRNGHDLLKPKKTVEPIIWLSASECEAVTFIMNKYGACSTSVLVNICHQEKAYKDTPANSPISFDLLLNGLSEEKKLMILGLLDIEEENDRVINELSK